MSTKVSDPKKYEFIKDVVDEHYGQCKILSRKEDGKLFCEIVRHFSGESKLNEQIKLAQQYNKNPHDNIVHLEDYSYISKSNLCSKVYSLNLLFEYCQNDLHKEILTRKDQQEPYYFQIIEIYSFLQSLTSALLFYKQNYKTNHGDLRPKTIFIYPDGTVKITTKLVQSEPMSAYHQFLIKKRSDYNIGPELFAALQSESLDPVYDAEKDDVFALGLVCLKSCLLQEDDIGIYDNKTYTINKVALQKNLQQVEQRYGKQLALFLQDMLQIHPKKRISLQSIEDKIFEYVQNLEDSHDNSEVKAPEELEVISKQTLPPIILEGSVVKQVEEPNYAKQPVETIQFRAPVSQQNLERVYLPESYERKSQSQAQLDYYQAQQEIATKRKEDNTNISVQGSATQRKENTNQYFAYGKVNPTFNSEQEIYEFKPLETSKRDTASQTPKRNIDSSQYKKENAVNYYDFPIQESSNLAPAKTATTQNQTIETKIQEQPAYGIDLQSLEEKIQAVLRSSKQVVEQYGGQNGLLVYQSLSGR